MPRLELSGTLKNSGRLISAQPRRIWMVVVCFRISWRSRSSSGISDISTGRQRLTAGSANSPAVIRRRGSQNWRTEGRWSPTRMTVVTGYPNRANWVGQRVTCCPGICSCRVETGCRQEPKITKFGGLEVIKALICLSSSLHQQSRLACNDQKILD